MYLLLSLIPNAQMQRKKVCENIWSFLRLVSFYHDLTWCVSGWYKSTVEGKATCPGLEHLPVFFALISAGCTCNKNPEVSQLQHKRDRKGENGVFIFTDFLIFYYFQLFDVKVAHVHTAYRLANLSNILHEQCTVHTQVGSFCGRDCICNNLLTFLLNFLSKNCSSNTTCFRWDKPTIPQHPRIHPSNSIANTVCLCCSTNNAVTSWRMMSLKSWHLLVNWIIKRLTEITN